MKSRYCKKANAQGFTLMEVLVAIAVTAIVAVIAAEAFSTAQMAHERTRVTLDRVQRMDRAWLALEVDIRNALSRVYSTSYGDGVLPFQVDEDEDAWLKLLRGGRANPMHFYRSELAYIAYTVDDEGTLIRETWIDPANQDEELSYKQKLLDGVEDVRVRLLARNARSVEQGPWADKWPPESAPEDLPFAIEITMDMEKEGEITRLFAMVPGR